LRTMGSCQDDKGMLWIQFDLDSYTRFVHMVHRALVPAPEWCAMEYARATNPDADLWNWFTFDTRPEIWTSTIDCRIEFQVQLRLKVEDRPKLEKIIACLEPRQSKQDEDPLSKNKMGT